MFNKSVPLHHLSLKFHEIDFLIKDKIGKPTICKRIEKSFYWHVQTYALVSVCPETTTVTEKSLRSLIESTKETVYILFFFFFFRLFANVEASGELWVKKHEKALLGSPDVVPSKQEKHSHPRYVSVSARPLSADFLQIKKETASEWRTVGTPSLSHTVESLSR